MQPRVFLGLGSNLPDRNHHLEFARQTLAALDDFTLVRASRIYKTAPVGYTDQPEFLNQVISGLWQGTPEALLSACQQIEQDAGRERPFPNAPRTLDIDILFWERRTLNTDTLTIPHPRLTERAFALVPLLELAPDLVDPHSDKALSSFLTSEILEQGLHLFATETADV